jgi:hypothetical protein
MTETSQCTEIDAARRKLFVKKLNVLSIPATMAALEEHLKRAIYQGGSDAGTNTRTTFTM